MSKPYSVLIIEDDLMLGNLFSQILKIKQYDVTLIQDGLNAMAYLQREVPDLILLDLHLPRMSGQDILTQIKQNKRFDGSKVAIITADVVHTKGLQGQADAVLAKPIRYKRLLQVCTELLEN